MLSTKSASAISSTSVKPSLSNAEPTERTQASCSGDVAVPQMAYVRMAQLYRPPWAMVVAGRQPVSDTDLCQGQACRLCANRSTGGFSLHLERTAGHVRVLRTWSKRTT